MTYSRRLDVDNSLPFSRVSFLDLISRSEEIDRTRRLSTQYRRFCEIKPLFFLAAERQLKTATVIAEVPFLPAQAGFPCNPDEFLALSNAIANIQDDLNETRQILHATRAEHDELQLEVEKA